MIWIKWGYTVCKVGKNIVCTSGFSMCFKPRRQSNISFAQLQWSCAPIFFSKQWLKPSVTVLGTLKQSLFVCPLLELYTKFCPHSFVLPHLHESGSPPLPSTPTVTTLINPNPCCRARAHCLPCFWSHPATLFGLVTGPCHTCCSSPWHRKCCPASCSLRGQKPFQPWSRFTVTSIQGPAENLLFCFSVVTTQLMSGFPSGCLVNNFLWNNFIFFSHLDVSIKIVKILYFYINQ